MISFITAIIITTILGVLLVQLAYSNLTSFLQHAIISAFILNILLIILTKYCEANENLFSHIKDLSFWHVLPHVRLYLILRPNLRLITLITLVIYPTIYLIMYILDLKILFVFSVVMFFSMVVSGVLWGWVLSWFLMGWPTPIRDEEVEFMNRLN